jgi:hypothetical protein
LIVSIHGSQNLYCSAFAARLDSKACMLIILADFMKKCNGIAAKVAVPEFVRGEYEND